MAVSPEPSVRAPQGMRREEYVALRKLLADAKPKHTLEIGMANGGSSVEICAALRQFGGVRHCAIDPFQSAPEGFSGQGIAAVRNAGYADLFEMIEDYDYLALPRLLAEGRKFDFILIDGWHSFDYAFIDFFYTDLLLNVGGIVAFHDTGWPSVHRVCRFLETHKPYEPLSPAISVYFKPSLPTRILGRLRTIARGPNAVREARSRRTLWFSLAAYRKLADRQVGNDHYVPF